MSTSRKYCRSKLHLLSRSNPLIINVFLSNLKVPSNQIKEEQQKQTNGVFLHFPLTHCLSHTPRETNVCVEWWMRWHGWGWNRQASEKTTEVAHERTWAMQRYGRIKTKRGRDEGKHHNTRRINENKWYNIFRLVQVVNKIYFSMCCFACSYTAFCIAVTVFKSFTLNKYYKEIYYTLSADS